MELLQQPADIVLYVHVVDVLQQLFVQVRHLRAGLCHFGGGAQDRADDIGVRRSGDLVVAAFVFRRIRIRHADLQQLALHKKLEQGEVSLTGEADVGRGAGVHMALLQSKIADVIALTDRPLHEGTDDVEIAVKDVSSPLRCLDAREPGIAVEVTDKGVQVGAALALSGQIDVFHRITAHAVVFPAAAQQRAGLREHIPDEALLGAGEGGGSGYRRHGNGLAVGPVERGVSIIIEILEALHIAGLAGYADISVAVLHAPEPDAVPQIFNVIALRGVENVHVDIAGKLSGICRPAHQDPVFVGQSLFEQDGFIVLIGIVDIGRAGEEVFLLDVAVIRDIQRLPAVFHRTERMRCFCHGNRSLDRRKRGKGSADDLFLIHNSSLHYLMAARITASSERCSRSNSPVMCPLLMTRTRSLMARSSGMSEETITMEIPLLTSSPMRA